jgi:hypothetical protein
MKPRIPIDSDALNAFGMPDTSGVAPVATGAARQQLRRVAFRMRTVDPVTSELVRIRNARHQRCVF